MGAAGLAVGSSPAPNPGARTGSHSSDPEMLRGWVLSSTGAPLLFFFLPFFIFYHFKAGVINAKDAYGI